MKLTRHNRTVVKPVLYPYPFGYQITYCDLITRFNGCRQWEDRYRQLIVLAKHLPSLSEALKQPGLALFYGDSEGRIVRGLLAVLLTLIEGKTALELIRQNHLDFFDELGLKQQLSVSRLNGVAVLDSIVIRYEAKKPYNGFVQQREKKKDFLHSE